MLSLLLGLVAANPNGAPRCQINEEGIARGMKSASDPALGYTLVFNRVNTNTWNFRVSAPAIRPDYQGLLLYVTSTTLKPTDHLGSFSFRNATKWKHQSSAICTQGGIVGSPNATVTHANPVRVPIANNVNFTWVATPQEMQMGGFVAQAVVASVDTGRTGLPRWVKVPNVSFGPAAVAPRTTTTNGGAYPTSTASTRPFATGTSSAYQQTISGFLVAAGLFFTL
jgi:hypothetical protein